MFCLVQKTHLMPSDCLPSLFRPLFYVLRSLRAEPFVLRPSFNIFSLGSGLPGAYSPINNNTDPYVCVCVCVSVCVGLSCVVLCKAVAAAVKSLLAPLLRGLTQAPARTDGGGEAVVLLLCRALGSAPCFVVVLTRL